LIVDDYKVNMNFHAFGFVFAATNGVVLATEKKQKSILYDDTSIHKIELITKNVGMVYSGMGPDYR
jgi:20S proteasome alpha/beta subunit